MCHFILLLTCNWKKERLNNNFFPTVPDFLLALSYATITKIIDFIIFNIHLYIR